jgi:hypothetical protein
LIWLAKIGKLSLLKELFSEILVPEEVYKEAVDRGLQEGFSDALLIREGFNQSWIKVVRLNEDEAAFCREILKHAFEIHLGEAQAIVLARRIGANALLLMDESSGRAFAEAWGLRVNGIIFVIMTGLRRGLLSGVEAKEAVLTLVQKGFRIEPKLLAKVIREIDAYKNSSKA